MTIEFKKPPLGFSMSKSKASKHMLIVLFAVIVILVFIIAFLSFFLALGFNTTSSNSHLDGKKENICTSKQCVKAGFYTLLLSWCVLWFKVYLLWFIKLIWYCKTWTNLESRVRTFTSSLVAITSGIIGLERISPSWMSFRCLETEFHIL